MSIEITVRCGPVGRIAWWLDQVAAPPDHPATAAGTADGRETRLGRVIVRPGVLGPGSASAWFDATKLPRPSAAACARRASAAFGCPVVGDSGAEYPDLDPSSPVMLEVSAAGERLFVPDAGRAAAG